MQIYVEDPARGQAVLAPCRGRRSVPAEWRECPEGCVAHFNAYADPLESGNNGVLEWTGLLRHTRPVAHWTSTPADSIPRAQGPIVDSIAVWHNDGDFLDAPSHISMSVWVVTAEVYALDEDFSALFLDEATARRYYEERVKERSEWAR